MTAILKVDTIQDTSGNNIINESSDTITIGASGDTTNIVGTLQNNGAALALGSLTMADNWRLTSDASFDSTKTDLTANLEQVDTTGQGTIGSAMTVSSGIFTFPSTGIYLVTAILSASKSGNSRYVEVHINVTTNNSSYATVAQGTDSINQTDSGSTKCNPIAQTLIDVTNTTNVKVKFSCQAYASCAAAGATNENRTCFTFIRLGDT